MRKTLDLQGTLEDRTKGTKLETLKSEDSGETSRKNSLPVFGGSSWARVLLGGSSHLVSGL